MKLTHKDRWERGFAALCKFRRRKGHCCPPLRHVESKYNKFNLGSWVSNQRYRRDGLSVERKRRLDKVGFVWSGRDFAWERGFAVLLRLDKVGFVWSGRDFAWERGFAVLLKFKRREGHCRIRGLHREGDYKLGWWVAVQRKKNVMSPKRRARLNKVGFVWNVYRRR
jgi:hypothetical protein